jgi:thiol-disulfide isomerase/thioredoxin
MMSESAKRSWGRAALLGLMLAGPNAGGAAAQPADPAKIDEVEKAYDEMLRARHQLKSDEDPLDPAAAARFAAVLRDAVALYREPADDKAALMGLTFMFAYCEQAPGSDVEKCRRLKRQGHALVLHRSLDSKELIGVLLHSTDADVAFVDAVFQKTVQKKSVQQTSVIADFAGRLWAHRYHDEKLSKKERQTAYRKVLEYGHVLEQDTALVRLGDKEIPLNRWRGEGLLESVQAQSVGQVMPDYSWRTFTGEPVSLRQHRGKVLLVDFWATWCAPCVASMPDIKKFREELAGKPFEVISINDQGGELETVVSFQSKKVPMPWINWRVDTDNEDYHRLGLASLPTYFVLDESGRILLRAQHFGDDVRQHIRAALNAPTS